MSKKLIVKHESESGETGRTKEVHAPTIAQALKNLAEQVKRGEVEVPFKLEFEGPGGLKFNVTVDSADDAQQISTMGFMF